MWTLKEYCLSDMNMFEDLTEFVNGVEMQMFKICSAAFQWLIWSYVL